MTFGSRSAGIDALLGEVDGFDRAFAAQIETRLQAKLKAISDATDAAARSCPAGMREEEIMEREPGRAATSARQQADSLRKDISATNAAFIEAVKSIYRLSHDLRATSRAVHREDMLDDFSIKIENEVGRGVSAYGAGLDRILGLMTGTNDIKLSINAARGTLDNEMRPIVRELLAARAGISGEGGIELYTYGSIRRED